MRISPTPNTIQTNVNPAIAKPGGATSDSFQSLMARQLHVLNEPHLQADKAIEQLATGQTDDVNGVVLQMAQADLTFRLAMEIRNKLIESYQEISRMQV